jgi:cytochrome P450
MKPFGVGAPPSSYLRNPYPALERLRDETPRYYSSKYNAWFLSLRADIEMLLRDERLQITRSSSFADHSPKFRNSIANSLRAWFSSPAPAIMEAVGAVAEECVSRLTRKAEVNLVDDVAQYLPSNIMANLLGIPASDLPPLQRLCSEVLKSYDLEWDDNHKAEVARAALPIYFTNHWRSAPDTPLLRLLRDAQGECDLPDSTMVDVCSKLFTAGTTTTAGCFANILARLFCDLAEENIPITVKNLEDLLRADTPVLAVKRTVSEPIHIGEAALKPGQTIYLMIATAHRKAEPSRQGRDAILTFGLGRYYCIGAALARLELRALIEKIAPLTPRFQLAAPILWRNSWLVHEASSISVMIKEAKHAD